MREKTLEQALVLLRERFGEADPVDRDGRVFVELARTICLPLDEALLLPPLQSPMLPAPSARWEIVTECAETV